MKITRVLVVALVTLLLPGSVFAQSYPTKPIRLVVPFPPAGSTDVVARIVARDLSTVLEQPVIVENKPGASGFIGTEAVARAQPDGHTLLLITSSTHGMSPALFKKLPYDPIQDFAMVGQFSEGFLILVVSGSSPVNSVSELISLEKAKSGDMTFASWGAGSAGHLAGELFNQTTGTGLRHIPYKGNAPAQTDLMGGRVSVLFDVFLSSLPHIRSGKFKGLAVTGPKRATAAPDIPTIAETYPGFEVTNWQGIGAPAQTPRSIINRLNSALCAVIRRPAVQEKFISLGANPVCTTPEAFATQIAKEIAKWSAVIKRANIPMMN